MWLWRKGERDVMLLTLKMEEEGHESRNMDGFSWLQKAREEILP